MKRQHQVILISSFLPLCWMAFMAVHELGHVLGAKVTGGTVAKVVIHPLAISRTDVSPNPSPLITVWAGPILGVSLPVFLWSFMYWWRMKTEFLARFFAGFCLVANGVYLGVGLFEPIGDAHVIVSRGTPSWCLWLFGIATVPTGLLLWNGIGSKFGFGGASGRVDPLAAYLSLALLVLALIVTSMLSTRT